MSEKKVKKSDRFAKAFFICVTADCFQFLGPCSDAEACPNGSFRRALAQESIALCTGARLWRMKAKVGHNLLFTVYYSPFTIHRLLFTIYYSPFTIHHLLFTVHHLRLTPDALRL
jgi:hypothetical protein